MPSNLRKVLDIAIALAIVIVAGGIATGIVLLLLHNEESVIPTLKAIAHILGIVLGGTGLLMAAHELRSIIVAGNLSTDAAAAASFSVGVGVVLLSV